MGPISKIVIASHNQGKVREIGELLSPFGFAVVSAAQLNVDEPEETGLTFAENALLKARNTTERTGMVALADDSGMAIAALGGAPGIYSARWAGESKDFSVAFERIKKELKEKNIQPNDGIRASFICALCLYFPGGENHIFEGRIDGTLTFPPRGDKGFGYDPVFIPEGYDITFAEMEHDKKQAISHRARAFAKLVKYLERNNLAA
jgi:XTP/dITP diphosphohydrolase